MLPHHLESSEQEVRQEIRSVVGDSPASEFQLSFPPRWIIEKSIHSERLNYEGAFEEVPIAELPRGSNLI